MSAARSNVRGWWLLLLMASALGCLSRGRYHCDDDRQCTSAGGTRGFCEAGGVCSFEDRGCALGRRYARFADEGGELAGRCVDARPCQGTPVIEVQAGGEHACLRRLDGWLFCWGRNDSGQLGEGSFSHRSTPTAVIGLPGAARAVALGAAFSCAVDSDRRVWCWGAGARGQLGDGVSTPPVRRAAPAQVSGLTGALELALGDDFACARSPEGVWCWGNNQRWALGRGDGGDTLGLAPAPVALPAPAEQIVAGAAHACARLRDGNVLCWGAGENGQLGVGDRQPRSLPTPVAGLADAVELAAGGAHTCARTRAGALLCWGDNQQGQLGLPASPPLLVPTMIADGAGATRVRLGARHTCLVLADESVTCFGGRDHDQLGLGASQPGPGPVAVAGLGSVLDLSVGGAFTCALQRDTTVRCWGEDGHGQLGAGAAVWRARPSPLRLAAGVTALATGARATCLLRAGEVACQGAATVLGTGSAADASTAAPVRIPAGVVELAVGASGACARTLDRDLWCWGAGDLPRPRTGVSAADQVSHGRAHACALSRARVLCWGENGFGQLGQPASAASGEPVAVPLPGGALQVSAGDDHTCARLEGGGVFCWGAGQQGQLGDGRAASGPGPVAVALTEAARALASGGGHSCALGESGRVFCWGRGGEGQLGQGAALDAPVPVAVMGLDAVEGLALGADHSCALRQGALHCWGANHAGQIGASSMASPQDRPRLVALGQPAKQVNAAGAHTCVVDGAGDAHCFGLDSHGQLGTGRLLSSAWPRPVALVCP